MSVETMRGASIRLPATLAAASILGLTTAGGAPSHVTRSGGSAQAYAIRIVVPGGAGAGTPVVSAPRDTVSVEDAFAYPADGSVLATGSAIARASASIGASARTQASSEVSSLSLFGGEVTVSRVTARAQATASSRTASADTAGSRVSGLVVLGRPAAGARVTLGNWGYADMSTGSGTRSRNAAANSSRASVTALTIRVTAAHGGLPAGSEIVVGYAEANAQADRPAQPTPTPTPRPTPEPQPTPGQEPAPGASPTAAPQPPPPTVTTGKPKGKRRPRKAQPTPTNRPSPKAPEPERPRAPRSLVRPAPLNITPRLTPRGYVFPVYGPASWSDTWGAPRQNTGWHHGADIFAPLGTPVLAVNDGTVFSVGWNDVGGNRLWLRDEQGNQFYYAHLSAFSPLAVNEASVEAGDVLGFVGNTGDAVGTPPHLHFEIHPVSLLALGYDGAVNPTRYLSAWQHLEDVEFPKARAAAKRAAPAGAIPVTVPSGAPAWVPRVVKTSPVPQPGAILLEAADISQASGLRPRSLVRPAPLNITPR
ncbi:MAG: M23 family metallopeptidase, partial [Actinomycetota bacterium]|nr:M23 family metallopeptidase [Actinomycetota bacterium]